MRVVVTGGCGYIGSVLVPKLLDAGHEVLVLDAMWFGQNLAPHERLGILEHDLRNGPARFENAEAVIHLAAVANDPCGELDAKLTWEVNVLATTMLAQHCKKVGVRQFIFASSASIYGIKDNRPVTETESFEPVSDYNKTKMVGEEVLASYRDAMRIQLVRPATVCGMSPRMRFDVIVNMLTRQALERGVITVNCGKHGASLLRPHTHIQDLTDLYVWLLNRPDIEGPLNVGFENISVGDLADLISKQIPVKIEMTEVTDKRSYAIDSSRLLSFGFKPKWGVTDAVREIIEAWNNGMRPDPSSMNLDWMRSRGLVQE